MKRSFILIYEPDGLNSIMGVYTSGLKLATAVKDLLPNFRRDCLVKIVPVDTWCGHVGGHDHQGTMLNEFLHCPVASDDSGD